MSNQPMAEVFGFPINNTSHDAIRHRTFRLCPFNNRVPNCTKDRASAPLGVCSVFGTVQDIPVITCPVRFRQNWLIAVDAASFFFPADSSWTSLTEVRLNDRSGTSAGNIDLVLVSYDDRGRITDFGSCEVQAVYISGNVRNPFEHFMSDPAEHAAMDWRGERNYPRPDFLSSSRKRLAPQLIFKGGIIRSWGKKQCVVLDRAFFDTLPILPRVNEENADLAWFVYRLELDALTNAYTLVRDEIVYTAFAPTLLKVTTAVPGPLADFEATLQAKLDEKLASSAPDAPILTDLLPNEDS